MKMEECLFAIAWEVFTLRLKDLAAFARRLTVAVAVLSHENEPWMTVTLLRQDNNNPLVVFRGESKKMTATCDHESFEWTFRDSRTRLTRTAQHGNMAFISPLNIEEAHK